VPFKIRLLNLAKIQIQAWHLPDQILDELYLFLTRVLPADIENNLVRAAQPYNGMIAECTRRDPTVPGREHHFVFQVYFGDDEQTLHVARGFYKVVDA